jgi:hypothetical protein
MGFNGEKAAEFFFCISFSNNILHKKPKAFLGMYSIKKKYPTE